MTTHEKNIKSNEKFEKVESWQRAKEDLHILKVVKEPFIVWNGIGSDE